MNIVTSETKIGDWRILAETSEWLSEEKSSDLGCLQGKIMRLLIEFKVKTVGDAVAILLHLIDVVLTDVDVSKDLEENFKEFLGIK